MKRNDRTRKKPANGRARIALSGNGDGASGGTPKRIRDRSAKKQALILAALELFATKGYEVTTTREIAALAGCAEGLIHRYFKGKGGLLSALLESQVSREGARSARPPLPEATLEDEFLQSVDQEVEHAWESRDFLRVFIPRAIVDPPVGIAMNKALTSIRAKAISDRLKYHQSRVEMARDASEALTQVVGLLGFVFGFVRPVLFGQDRVRAKKMAMTLARMFVSSSEIARVIGLPDLERTSVLMLP